MNYKLQYPIGTTLYYLEGNYIKPTQVLGARALLQFGECKNAFDNDTDTIYLLKHSKQEIAEREVNTKYFTSKEELLQFIKKQV